MFYQLGILSPVTLVCEINPHSGDQLLLIALRIFIKYQRKVSDGSGCLTVKSFTEFADSGLLLKIEVEG